MLFHSNLLQFFPSSLYSNCSVPNGEQKSTFLEAIRKRGGEGREREREPLLRLPSCTNGML